MKRLGLIVAVVALAVLLYRPATSQDNYDERIASLETRVAVLEGTPSSAATVSISGTLTFGDLSGASFVPVGATCVVEGDDGLFIADTLPVVIANEAGAEIGRSELLPGQPLPTESAFDFDRVESCVFPFIVEDIPAASSYTIEIGSDPDDIPPVTFSADELAQAGFRVDIAIGESASSDVLTPTAP